MTHPAAMTARAWAELLLLSVIWGGSFLSIHIALEEIPVLTSVLHRVGWAALLLWAVVLAMRLPLPRAPRLWGAFLVMGVLNNIVPFGLMAWAQLHIETGLVSILNATTAIFGVLVAAMLLPDERLTGRRLLGVVIGFLGVATAIGLDSLLAFDPGSLAQLAVLAGALSYAFAGTWARRRLSGLAPQVAAAGMLTASALVLAPLAWALEGPPDIALSARTWGAVAYYAGAATALAYLLYYRVLAMAGAGNLLLCTLLIPPVAIALGVVLLGETPEPASLLGFGMLALGLLILDGRLFRARNSAL